MVFYAVLKEEIDFSIEILRFVHVWSVQITGQT